MLLNPLQVGGKTVSFNTLHKICVAVICGKRKATLVVFVGVYLILS